MLAGISVNQNLCEGKIAMSAYSDLYLSDAMRNLGGMLDYAVNDCSISMRTFLEMFILSGKAELFECGNPSLISGMSGEELAIFVIQKSGLTCEIRILVRLDSGLSAVGNRLDFPLDLQWLPCRRSALSLSCSA